MSIESTLHLRPWRWSLQARLRWARWCSRGDAERLARITEHIIQSHRVQTTELAGGQKARDRFHVLSIAAERTRSVPGRAMEFGVFEGITLRHIAGAIGPNRRLTGFDTFQGLPDDWGQLLPKGTFATKAPSLEGLPNVSLVVGRIEETLPAFVANLSEPVSLLHIDVPYHGINVCILERVLPYMPEGSVVVFDEYYGYPSFEDHEFRAWSEIRARFELVATPIAYSSRSAAFELVRNPAARIDDVRMQTSR
jgi:Methyltransferase domain